MHPKSHKEFSKDIADEVGVHPQVVDDFITFYYAKLRKKLSALSFPKIYLEGLGTFELRKNKLEKAILKNKSLLGNIAKRTYNGYAKSENITRDILQMEEALEKIKNEILNKKKFRDGK
jgi:nucleoid DNA-binding protein